MTLDVPERPVDSGQCAHATFPTVIHSAIVRAAIQQMGDITVREMDVAEGDVTLSIKNTGPSAQCNAKILPARLRLPG